MKIIECVMANCSAHDSIFGVFVPRIDAIKFFNQIILSKQRHWGWKFVNLNIDISMNARHLVGISLSLCSVCSNV